MNVIDVKNRISELCSHFTFEYRGMDCGVDPLSQSRFDMWCGDEVMVAKSIDDVMRTPFFAGESLQDIVNEINIVEM